MARIGIISEQRIFLNEDVEIWLSRGLLCTSPEELTLRTTVLVILTAFFLTSALAQKQKPQPKPGTEAGHKQAEAAKPESAASTPAAEADQDEHAAEGPWKGMQYRLVGPFRGGRVVAVSGVVGQDDVYYFGAVAGGVWKTTDGGLNWKPMFDKTKDASPSIGAIAVSESDPNVIYVGTGEACIRGNIVGGNGVWKSVDAGKTWKFVGLADTHSIGRLAVNPKNPDIAFVAALGHPFADNEERGIFRTRDGGKTWEKVLYKDAKSGGIDVVFDPNNSNILFAALWQAKRTPWSMDSGGPGSGLYRSIDGGTTWKELKGHGLPEGVLGRIGVTVSGANPNRVWAVIEAEKGGIYRSDDGGDSWHLMTDDHRFRQRAWYYSHIFADPKSAETVYILNTGAYRSNDGGKTFSQLRAPHGDNHGLWIDPTNPKRLINGNDGGATISTNGGESWTSEYNQPTAQFYHVTTDNRFPYYIYGAQQDNSTVAIADASAGGFHRSSRLVRRGWRRERIHCAGSDGSADRLCGFIRRRDYAARSAYARGAVDQSVAGESHWLGGGGCEASFSVDRTDRFFAARCEDAVFRRRSFVQDDRWRDELDDYQS